MSLEYRTDLSTKKNYVPAFTIFNFQLLEDVESNFKSNL